MEPLIYIPTYELFFVLEPLRFSFKELTQFTKPLGSTDAPALLGADVYYRAETDVALLALRFDERTLSYRELGWVLELAAGMGIPTLDPSRLSDEDRRQFYRSYLSTYELRVEDLATADAALQELGTRLGLVKNRASTHTEAPKELPSLPTAPVQRKRAGSASGLPRRRRLGSAPPPMASVPHGQYARGKLSLSEQAAKARADVVHRAPTVRVHGIPDIPKLPEASGKDKPRGRVSTREITRAESPRARTDRKNIEADVAPEAPLLAPPVAVRVLRSGQWTTARLGALSNKGAYIVTGGLPHRGELVQLALGYGDVGAMIVGRVSHVTSIEDATQTGQSGFAVKFDNQADTARTHLISLLRRARKAGVRLTAPPPRAAVRFPVHWPVRVGTAQGGFEAAALDLSPGGLFVATPNRLGDQVVFRLPLDTSERSVNGRAEVVREVSGAMARDRGLISGYGLRIVELSSADRRRYRAFLRRVRVRTEKRVIIGASPDRIDALTLELASSGYTVSGGSNAQSLLALADSGARTPDVVIIDASLAAFGLNVEWVQQVFAGRRVPCVSTDEGTAARARGEVDRVLSIAA